ncbi:MAG: phosphoribosyl-ATP diphosphatase [Pseudomonadota bacterium]
MSALERLAATIRARRNADGDMSYTRQLLDAGVARCARKFGEEAVELVVAAVAEDKAALTGEAADTFYHLLVLLEAREISLEEVFAELDRRAGTSGVAEKAARGSDGS